MKPLYEIANDYMSLLHELVEAPELTDEHLSLLDEHKDHLEKKIVNVGAFIKNMEAEYHAIENAIEDMIKRSTTLSGKIDRLKDYLKINMERFNMMEVKSPQFDIKIRNNPPSAIIEDEKLIPKQYIRETIVSRIDKAKISQELKNNVPIPGAFLDYRTRIEIR